LGEVRQLCAHSPVPVEVKAHGFQRLMLSKNDLVGELIDRGIASETDRVFLRDERGYEFRIVRKEGRTVIYNSIELCMLTHMRELMDCGADVIRLELGLHEREEVERIVSAYRRVMDGGTCVLEGRYTTGHYFRGVE
ncbi:MAG: U32 family peptidase, partial [Methermicoccaceae archaeon]